MKAIVRLYGAGTGSIGTEATLKTALRRKAARLLSVVGVTLLSVAVMIVLQGCGGSPTGPGSDTAGQTPLGIKVMNGGSDLYGSIDQSWTDVNHCWKAAVSTSGVSVEVKVAEVHDKSGQGGFTYQGQLVYGVRIDNRILVADDLAALRHEFSHLVGEKAQGARMDNGAGQCWL